MVFGPTEAAMGDTLRGVNVAAASIAVLVADTSVILEGAILGKPGSVAEAESMIARLEGRTHEVWTRFAIGAPTNEAKVLHAETVVTRVTFRALTPERIRRYAESGEGDDKAGDDVVIAGERNLLSVSEFSSDMGNLRRMFDLFEQKTLLMRLLDVSTQAEGVRIYIGGESQVVPYEDLSVVTAPYEVDGQVVGTLGVIGPQRMAYDRMIQIVDITAKLVSNALSHGGKAP